MAVIPTYFAQEEAETARLPRAPVRRLADTGQGLEARAIEGLGRDIEVTSGYLALINEIEGNSQFDTARRKVRESYNDFLFGLEDNNDPATYPKAYKKFLKEAGKLAPVNQVGNQKYQQWLQLQTPVWDTKMEWARRDMVKLNAQDAYITNLMGVLNFEDRKEAEAEARTLTAGAATDRIFSPRQLAADYQRIMAEWDEKDKVGLIEGIYDDAKAMPYEEAVTFINDMKGLSSAERNDLVTRRKRDRDFADTAAVEQLETQQRSDRQRILERFIKKDFGGISEFIDLTMLDPTEKLRWIEKAEVRAVAISEGKDDPMLVTVPATYFELWRRIARGEKVTESELADYVGNGISISNYKELLGMLEIEEKSPLMKPQVKAAVELFGRIRAARQSLAIKAGEWDEDKVLESELKWLVIENDFTEYILGKPDASDSDIEKKVESLATIPKEDATNGFFKKLGKVLPYLFTPYLAFTLDQLAIEAAKKVYEKLFGDEEVKFQKWYDNAAKRLGLNPDPDAPEHFYDYRAAYKAGITPPLKKDGHWPSEFKITGHPSLIVGGRDTRTGQPVQTATNPKTGEKIISYDGGETWQPLK